jgi:hypothetical protein
MRFVLGLLSGVLGMLAGWLSLGILVINLNAAGRDLGTVMMAFFEIGPVGGLIGFIIGVLLFTRLGLVRAPATPRPGAVGARAGTHISRSLAIAILALAGGAAWWGWHEFLR